MLTEPDPSKRRPRKLKKPRAKKPKVKSNPSDSTDSLFDAAFD